MQKNILLLRRGNVYKFFSTLGEACFFPKQKVAGHKHKHLVFVVVQKILINPKNRI